MSLFWFLLAVDLRLFADGPSGDPTYCSALGIGLASGLVLMKGKPMCMFFLSEARHLLLTKEKRRQLVVRARPRRAGHGNVVLSWLV
jgi:hypothetical protein